MSCKGVVFLRKSGGRLQIENHSCCQGNKRRRQKVEPYASKTGDKEEGISIKGEKRVRNGDETGDGVFWRGYPLDGSNQIDTLTKVQTFKNMGGLDADDCSKPIVRLWAASCGIVDNFLALHPLFDAIYAPTGGYGRHQVRQSLAGVMAKTQPHPSDSWSWIPDNAIPYMKILSIDGCYQFNKSTKLPPRTVNTRSNRPQRV
ncbi:Uncharacterized protein LW94_7119 [Fusarium fujikuroi]|nr:Uncharacterized protein Y057_14066 [Fusarium fujikuroi]KLP22589.1 Uncharacterized protein LW94_7119 [Fusarium fujikuroi]